MGTRAALTFAVLMASSSLASCTRGIATRAPVVELQTAGPIPGGVTRAPAGTIAPVLTATPSTGGVSALLASQPEAMESVEIDAYHGEGYVSWPGRGRYESMSGCPSADTSPLTDRALWLSLSFGGGASSNPIPDGAPWLIAAVPGEGGFPELPRFGRLRGHLGDPAFAYCPDADRIFTVEEVVATYEEKRSGERPDEDFRQWVQYRDPDGRFLLAYPPDWNVTPLDDDRIDLLSVQRPNSPVSVTVVQGKHGLTAPAGVDDLRMEQHGFRQTPPEAFADADVPTLVGAVRYCAGSIVNGCVEVVFSDSGREYVLTHEYPTGFDARPDTLWTFQGMVNAFQIEGRATVTPTPAPRSELGDGPFWTRDQAEAMALNMIPYGPWTVTDATLVSEAEAVRLDLCETRRDDPQNQWYTWPEGIWIVELAGVFEGRDTVFYTYLNAETGFHICTAEKGTRGSAPRLTIRPPRRTSRAASANPRWSAWRGSGALDPSPPSRSC